MSESLNEVLIMPHQPAKHVDLDKGFQQWELLYHMHVLPAGMDSLSGYVVHQVHNL